LADFSIETYDRRFLEGMARVHNDETAFEPQIAPLTPERFIRLVEKKSYFDPSGLFIAARDGRVLGWVHACVAAGTEPWHDPNLKVARIRMLLFPRESLQIGGALAQEATAWLRRAGFQEMEAMHPQAGYPFYRGLWFGGEPMCPVSLPHVHLALETAGYKNTHESIFMVARMQGPPGEVRPRIAVEFEDDAALANRQPIHESWIGYEPKVVHARIKGEIAGSISWVVLPYCDGLGAPAMNVFSLFTREACRHQGLATALVSRAMRQGHALGCRTASVGTQLWNSAAHATYSRLGFQPYCLLVGRQLRLPAETK
jgi:GNAT superfamily N-acetyltransferase